MKGGYNILFRGVCGRHQPTDHSLINANRLLRTALTACPATLLTTAARFAVTPATLAALTALAPPSPTTLLRIAGHVLSLSCRG
jgi:hypothetical protein